MPGLPINVGVARLVLVGEVHAVATVLEGVSVAVVRGSAVLVGGWKIGAATVGEHDGYAVVS